VAENEGRNQETTLILGAGAAGLAAAQRIAAAGLPVTVLEARNRIGGRIHTTHGAWPLPIEAGPEFLHGHGQDYQQILDRAGTSTAEIPNRHLYYRQGQAREGDFQSVWQSVFQRLEEYSGPDLSFADFLDREGPPLAADERAMAVDYVEGFNAADKQLLSIDWLRRSEASVSEETIERVTSGFDRILQAILRDTDRATVVLNSLVSTLRWSPGNVEADVVRFAGTEGYPSGGTQTFRARRAILTLPLAVLKQSVLGEGLGKGSVIRFQPELVAKQVALGKLAMGTVVKVALWFREPFWKPLMDGGFLHIPQARFLSWWMIPGSNILTGWSGGPRAEPLSRQQNDVILAAALGELAQALKRESAQLRELLVDSRVFNWQRDVLAGGAYSYAKVGGIDAARELAEPIDDTLFFAGEATDSDYPATVGGAVRSGYRAADEVIARCR
jgi:monoamine oxidase